MILNAEESESCRFHLVRNGDYSGVSGEGHVADGVMFADGVCVLRWRTEASSTAVYATIDDLIAIHGHGGKTKVVWNDRPPGYDRGMMWAYQDRCEGCFPLDIFAEGDILDCIPMEHADWFLRGYADGAEDQFGENWRDIAASDHGHNERRVKVQR